MDTTILDALTYSKNGLLKGWPIDVVFVKIQKALLE